VPEPSVETISANIVDVLHGTIRPGTLAVAGGRIAMVREEPGPYSHFLLPGFIDSHVHIESSMLVPAEFARAATIHGTVAAVADPHEIANVLGLDGMHYMTRNARNVPFHFCFGASPCVPATEFETSGARLGAMEVEELLASGEAAFLSEVMNVPGVLHGDPELLGKLAAATRHGCVIDGHAPGLRGPELQRYIAAGITADHESLSPEEALEKVAGGMQIQIREGSAARSLDAFLPVARQYPRECMFCSDDKHPDDLIHGHINDMVRRAVAGGMEVMDVLRVASVNPIRRYRLPVGLLQAGDSADFILVDNLRSFNVLATWVRGRRVAERGQSLLAPETAQVLNRFVAAPQASSSFAVPARDRLVNVIEALDGQLVTNRLRLTPKTADGNAVPDPERDILKLAVVNRYAAAKPAVGFIRGFGLREGAIASSIAHDSHNIIAVGTSDADLCRAVNRIVHSRGGICAVGTNAEELLPLPVAGLMSDAAFPVVARRYVELDQAAKRLGCRLHAPFMTLSFMALLVIPELKLSDRGLFDGRQFAFTDLF